jgi:hypothetical protein
VTRSSHARALTGTVSQLCHWHACRSVTGRAISPGLGGHSLLTAGATLKTRKKQLDQVARSGTDTSRLHAGGPARDHSSECLISRFAGVELVSLLARQHLETLCAVRAAIEHCWSRAVLFGVGSFFAASASAFRRAVSAASTGDILCATSMALPGPSPRLLRTLRMSAAHL